MRRMIKSGNHVGLQPSDMFAAAQACKVNERMWLEARGGAILGWKAFLPSFRRAVFVTSEGTEAIRF